MINNPRFILTLVAFYCVWASPDLLIADNPVQINIRSSEVGVSKRVITVGDLADVSEGTQRLRNQISELDIDSISKNSSRTTVSVKQIEVRLMLAGIATTDFEVSGPDTINVRLTTSEDLQQKIELDVQNELATQFGLKASDVQVQLLDKRKLRSIQKSIDTSNFTTMVVFPVKLPIGEKTIQVDFVDNIGNRVNSRLAMRILVVKEVLVTKNRIPRGTVITADYVQRIRRPIADDSVQPADASHCLGCVAKTDIPQHEVLATSYLTKPTEQQQMLVKRNDFVDVVIERGPITIRLKNAKVLSPGSAGDVVQVLNTSTNKPLTAIVRDKQTVVVTH